MVVASMMPQGRCIPCAPTPKIVSNARRMQLSTLSRVYANRGPATDAQCASNNEELLTSLRTMKDTELENFMVTNRDQITLDFLGWVAECEGASSGAEQRRLWELGSKLMALREGYVPVAAQELAEGLARIADNPPAVPGPGSLATAVQRNHSLGLSVDGMVLLEQQAAALEATVGATRAQALTEVLGRKQVAASEGEMAAITNAGSAAGRILEVLVQIEDREERAAMLPDAFTPLESSGTSAPLSSGEEEEIYTTPLQLLQAVDLWLLRLGKSASVSGGGGARQAVLPGAVMGLDAVELKQVLKELREDILGAWDATSGEEF